VDDTREKLKYDLFYIKNSNVWLDLWIVAKTIKVVLMGVGAR
jgi:lipopolysaccharide/colanic/teichoic acid biosynthesis glycosyltransferase